MLLIYGPIVASAGFLAVRSFCLVGRGPLHHRPLLGHQGPSSVGSLALVVWSVCGGDGGRLGVRPRCAARRGRARVA
eukprot:8520563-Alexandrium_andersonii.AAC.1